MNYKRVLILTAATAAILSAADAEKTFSPEFTKAGLKALISIRNGNKQLATAAMTDAEVAAANDNDRDAFQRIAVYRATLDSTEISRYHVLALVRMGAPVDPGEQDSLNDRTRLTAICGVELEKMMHDGGLLETPTCNRSKAAMKEAQAALEKRILGKINHVSHP